MEYKRAAVMLPSILRRAMILAAVCLTAAGMIAFCAGILQSHEEEPKLRIGYTAEKSRVVDLAVSYVQNMESVKSICRLEAVTEHEGKQLLESGELSAWIVLPEDIIHEILSGSNAPAIVYLPGTGNAISGGGMYAVGSMLFEELASAGMGMLGTAQAEIYASAAILQELAKDYMTDDFLQFMYDDINRLNLEIVAGREKLFRTRTLSLTENNTYAVYYGSALFAIYVLLAGLFFGNFCKRSGLQQTMLSRRIGVGYVVQLTARCLAGNLLALIVSLLPFLLFFIPQVNNILSVTVSFAGMISLLLIIIFVTIYYMMIYQIIEKRESALVVTGVLAVLQAYLSGCLIPSVLLPKAVIAIGKLLPAAMIKAGATILFTGDTQAFYYVAAGLAFWCVCLFSVTVFSMHMGDRSRSAAEIKRVSSRIHVPSLGMVMFRRLLHRKSVWFSLIFAAVLSAVITETEKSSETQIKAAVYDESGNYIELLKAYDGLVHFEQYESDEAVQDAVRRGHAECGYVLPQTLTEDMSAMNADREILVYKDADAVAVPVVNEILFERIFRQVSLKWFGEYISQNLAVKEPRMEEEQLKEIAEKRFNEELLAGTTFRFEIKHMEYERENADSQIRGNDTTYPVYAVAGITVILCTLQGILQVIADIRDKNFYKRNRAAASMLTLILPVILGGLCALLIIMAGT